MNFCEGLAESYPLFPGGGLWFFSVFFSRFLIFSNCLKWPYLMELPLGNWPLLPEVSRCVWRIAFRNAGSKFGVSSIIKRTLLFPEHESRKSWMEHAPVGMILWAPHAIFLPELIDWRISRTMREHKRKSSNEAWKCELFPKATFPLTTHEDKSIFRTVVSLRCQVNPTT